MKFLASIFSVALLSITVSGLPQASDSNSLDIATMQKASTIGPHYVTFDGKRRP
ncbi:hypothetical protein N9K16_00510 [Alphaproteobacteria bacterium]|nr:hypothetical protein [Alphaproteobacteria bacterium]